MGFKWLMTRLGAVVVPMLAACTGTEKPGGPDRLSLSLPDAAIVFDAASLEVRREFQVESDEGRYDLEIGLVTVEATYPSLELQLLDAEVPVGGISNLVAKPSDPYRAILAPLVRLDCQLNQFPCVQRFAVVATIASDVQGPAVTGTLAVKVLFSESFHQDAYLAIEPL